MPLSKINGQWIHYEDTGGNLQPLVLAHGLLMDQEMFAPQVEALGSQFRVIAWDARCHGETESTDDPFSYWDLADDLWESDGMNDQLAETIAAIILGNEWPGREAWIAKWRQWPRSLLRPAFNALVGREDIHDRLGEIKAPALVIHGTADAAIDIELAQRLCATLANSRPLIMIEGGGHASNLTHPALVNQAVRRYLFELDPGTPPEAERRYAGRRSDVMRRLGERREPVRASAGRRVLYPFERRMADRRSREGAL